jgi:hypothetical protein
MAEAAEGGPAPGLAPGPGSEYSGCFWQNAAAEYRNGDEADGVYTLKTGGRIFVNSDLEGMGICILNAKSRGVIGTKSAEELRNVIFRESHSIAPLLADIITVSADGEIGFAGATPEILNPNNHMFCFLGDAWGVGPNNIELVRSFINLKRKNPKFTMLLLGNRDILRGRKSIETMLTKESRDALKAAMKLFNQNPQNPAAIAALNAVEIVFEYKVAADAVESSYIDYLYSNDTSSPDHGFTIEKETTALGRADAISVTMTEYGAWEYIVDEYLKMCGVNPCSVDRETKCKIYLHLVRVMSTDDLELDECHPAALAFVNIYQDQLDASDLCALLQMEATRELAYFAHGSLVRKIVPTEPGTIFEVQLPKSTDKQSSSAASEAAAAESSSAASEAAKPSSGEKPNLAITKETVMQITDYKDDLIKKTLEEAGKLLSPTEGIKAINANMKKYRKHPDAKYWLSFISGINSQSAHIYYDKEDNRNFSGINHSVTGSFGNPKMVMSGGRSRILNDSLNRSTTGTGVDLGDERIKYYFAGHSPQGYMAACIKAPDNGKYYISVDVSKIDAQTYKNIDRYTCCCLILEPIAEGGLKKRIIGRFVLENKDIMDKTQQGMFSEKCYVHYDHEINDDDINGERYIGLPELTDMTTNPTRKLKISYFVTPKFEKQVTITLVSAEGGVASSTGKEGGSRKKRSYKVKRRNSTRGRTRK